MDLKFKFKMLKIELKEEFKNYYMNKQIQKKVYALDGNMDQMIWEIAYLIKSNNLFQPSIITKLIGRRELDVIKKYPPVDRDFKLDFPYDFLEMKKIGIDKFKLIGSRTKSNGEIIWLYKNESNNLDGKIYALSGDYEYYEKKYDELYEKSNAFFKSLEKCTYDVRYYFYSNGKVGEEYFIHLSQEEIEKRVLMYVIEFVYAYYDKHKTKMLAIKR